MALIKCPECKNEVSDKAKACPRCGYPVAELYKPSPTASVTNSIETMQEQQGKAQEYNRIKTQLMLINELNAGRESGEIEGWIPAADVRNKILMEQTETNRAGFDIAGSLLVKYIGHRNFVIVPNGITNIDSYAFNSYTNLQSIAIPRSVTSIGDGAFGRCENLRVVMLPDSVTEIGSFAFSSCSNLKEFKIPNGMTEIADHTFNFCTSLVNVSIPSGVKSIGAFAFQECRSLEKLFIPDGVSFIGAGAFNNCASLTDITLPNSLNKIVGMAFGGCKHLVIHAFQGSYAAKYAREHGISFSPIKEQMATSEFFTKIVGVTFEGRQETVSKLYIGQELVFIPDKANSYDRFAVKVCTTDGKQVGYVAKTCNEQIFHNLVNGLGEYKVCVSDVTGSMNSNYGCNIRVRYFEKGSTAQANCDASKNTSSKTTACSIGEFNTSEFDSIRKRWDQIASLRKQKLQEINRIILTKKTVTHEAYGKGMVESCTGGTIYCNFNGGMKKFLFPDVFLKGFASIDDEGFESLIKTVKDCDSQFESIDKRLKQAKEIASYEPKRPPTSYNDEYSVYRDDENEEEEEPTIYYDPDRDNLYVDGSRYC